MKNFIEITDSATFQSLPKNFQVAFENVGCGGKFYDRLNSLAKSWMLPRVLAGRALMKIRKEMDAMQKVIDDREYEQAKVYEAQRVADQVV